MASFLPPVDKPRGLMLRLVYVMSRRRFGKVPTPIAVFGARVPTSLLSFIGKVSRLDKKLRVPTDLQVLVRHRVASINMCLFCMDSSRWFAMQTRSINIDQLDALDGYQTSPLFTEAQRAALDYATELTRDRSVLAATFERLRDHYSEEEICDLVWLVSTEHLYNVTNIGMDIGSDGLCDLGPADARLKAVSL
jgi:alkylhydroperoxidase family enzyme